MNLDDHYLKREIYDLIQKDSSIFEFLQRDHWMVTHQKEIETVLKET